MRSFHVKNNYSKFVGQNIYKSIGNIFPSLGIGNLNKVFRLKDVKVNGVRVDKSYILNLNDLVEIYLTDDLLFGIPKSIQIVFEDENVLVAFKPTGMPSCNESHIYSKGDIFFENLVKISAGENIKICHRLDTNTQGLVIFSKNSLAHKELLEAFKNHKIEKKYLTLVYNRLPNESDILRAYLMKNKTANTVRLFDKPLDHSEEIITQYRVLDYFQNSNVSLLEVTLHTGKTHQIRAHLSYIGNPVIGDPKYCSNEINKKFKFKSQALVAYSYTFEFGKTSKLNYLNSKKIQLDKCELIKNFKKDLGITS